MDSVDVLLKKKHGGIFYLKSHATPAELEKAARNAGFAYFHIEGQKLNKKEQFLNHAALALHFPEYFGHNWDAFEDCLMDFSWCDSDHYLIVYDHTDAFSEHSPENFDTLLEILKEATAFWQGQGKAMITLLRGKHPIEGIEAIE